MRLNCPGLAGWKMAMKKKLNLVLLALCLIALVFISVPTYQISSQIREQSRKLQEVEQNLSQISSSLSNLSLELKQIPQILQENRDMSVKLLEGIIGQSLREFAGGGNDISAKNPLPVLEASNVVRKIMVDPDVEARHATTLGAYAKPVIFYRYHQYVLFVDHNDEIKFAKRLIGSTDWHIYPTGITNVSYDQHFPPHFEFDRNGYIILFYNTYSGTPRWRVSLNPVDPSAFGPENTVMTGSNESYVSYPVLVKLADVEETLLLFYRAGDPTATDPENTLRWYLNRWNPDTKSWEALQHPLIDRLPPGMETGAGRKGAYISSPAPIVDKQNRIHLFFIWRSGGGNNYNRNLSYMRSDDGGKTWKRSDGTPYTLPVTFDTAEVVDEVPVEQNLEVPSVYYDEDNNPWAAYIKRGDNGIAQIWVVHHDGSQWIKEQISHRRSPSRLDIPPPQRRILSLSHSPRIILSTQGDILVFHKDGEFGNGIILYAKLNGSDTWNMYSVTLDNLRRTTVLGIDYSLFSLWPYQNQVHILAQASGGGEAVAPLYLYELHLPLMEVKSSFQVIPSPSDWETKQAVEVLIKSSLPALKATTLDDCSRVPIADNNLSLTIEATYAPDATQGIAVHIYTSYDGTKWDTEEYKDTSGNPVFGIVPFTAGESIRVTRSIPVSARFIKVTVENQDVAQPVTNVKVIATIGG
jgi:hypothetical protein